MFRAKLAECDRALKKIAGWSLFDELLAAPGDSRLNRAEFVQPALSAMQIALAELWNSWGVQPDFVAAHSLGEWAAACVAGALSVEETMRVVVESSRAQAKADIGGGMAVVELAEAEVRKKTDHGLARFLSPAATARPRRFFPGMLPSWNIVTNWKEEGLTCSLIDVDVAAHSPRMDSAARKLKRRLGGLRPIRTAIPFVSSIRGTKFVVRRWGRNIGHNTFGSQCCLPRSLNDWARWLHGLP